MLTLWGVVGGRGVDVQTKIVKGEGKTKVK